MEDLLYRILSREIVIRINDLEYIIKAPDVKLKYRAQLYKKGLINKYKYELPLLESFNTYLISNRFIEADYETKLKNMNSTIKKFKVELFLAGPKIESQKKIRENLKIMRAKLNSYYAGIELYQRNSLEHFVESLKNKFVLINTAWQEDKLALDQDNLDLELLGKLIEELNKEDISSNTFRDLALSEDWRSYYLGNQYNIFGIPAIDFSEEQKILSGYTRMYQNAFDHPECPDDKIIKDHDIFDGWMIFEQDKRKAEKKQQVGSNIDPKFQEVFISAESQEEAKSIYDANTPDGKRILKERAKVMKGKEEVRDIQFRDVKLDILSGSSRAQSEHFKNIGK